MANTNAPSGRSLSLVSILGLSALGACFFWAYWPTLAGMADRWAQDPVYSHGYLVPAFALALLWFRRGKLGSISLHTHWRGGLALVVVAVFIRLVGTYFYYPWLDAISLLPCLGGLCLLLAGWEALKWSWPAIAFLFFMMPLPYRVEVALREPLQNLATHASTYTLQTLGCPAFAEGNVIALSRIKLGVYEACSGLSMLLIFFALSAAVALLIQRPLWEKCLIVVSAVPIAIVANVVRITATGLLYQTGQDKAAALVFHDLAGWMMMPLGLGLLWMELKVLGRMLVVAERPRALPAPFFAPSLVARNRTKEKGCKRRRRRIA